MKIIVMKEKCCCCNVIEILILISKYINYIYIYIYCNGLFYFIEEILIKRFNLIIGVDNIILFFY